MVKYIKSFINTELLEIMEKEIPWRDDLFARQELFMSDIDMGYQYIEGGPVYNSIRFHHLVKEIMNKINYEFGFELDVCFLNYYNNGNKALGWHSDESHPIDHTQPIVVVSIGSIREISWKSKDKTNKEISSILLDDGSLFIMPPGMQQTHLHRISKSSDLDSKRISLTFRKWKS